MKRKTTLLAAFAALFAGQLQGQQSLGLQSGNFSTPYAAFLNPANTYSSKSRTYLNLYTASMGYTTNAFSYNFPVNPFRLNNRNFGINHTNANGNLDFRDDFLQLKDVENAKGYLLNENFGPSLFFRANRFNAYGFGIKSVSGASFNGINANTAQLMRYGTDTSGGAFTGTNALEKDKWYSNDAFGIDALSYQEWFFSWAYAARDERNSFVKVGVTFKGILAQGQAGLHASSLDYRVNSNNELEVRNTDLAFTHTSDETASQVMQDPYGLNFSDNSGAGAGIDVGFVYENRPRSNRKTVHSKSRINCSDEKANEYSWKFGASLTDLGFISMDGSRNNLMNSSNISTWNYNSSLLDQTAYAQTPYDRFARVDQAFMRQLGATNKTGYSVYTPAAVNAEFDVRLNKGLYLAANWTQNLLSKNTRGLKRNSYLALTPRRETEKYEIGFPVVLNQDYTRLNIGAYGRLGAFVFGTDNLAGLADVLSNNEHSSGSIYFGARFKIDNCAADKKVLKRMKKQPEEVTEDEVFWSDTPKNTDRIVRVERDTIYKVLRDTVYKSPKTSEGDLRKVQELRKREEDVLKREKGLRDRELEVTKRESKVGTSGSGVADEECQKELFYVKRDRDNLKSNNSVLQDKINQYEFDLKKGESRIAIVEAESLRYKKAANECEDRSLKSSGEIERLKEALKRCSVESKNPCETQTKSLESLLKIEKEKLKKSEIEIVKLKRAQTYLDKELRKSKAQYIVLKKTNDDLVKRWGENGDCCGAYSGATKEIELLKKQVLELPTAKTRIVFLEKEINILKRKLAQEMDKPKGSDCSSEKAKISSLEKEITNLKVIVAQEKGKAKGSDCSSEKAKVISQAKEITTLKASLAQEKSKAKGSDCSSEKAKISSLEKEITNLKVIVAQEKGKAKGSDCSKEKARIVVLEKELSAVKVSLNKEIAEGKRKQLELEECKKKAGAVNQSEITQLKKTIQQKEVLLKSKDGEILKLKADLSSKNTKIKSLEAELVACKAKGSKDCSKCEEELKQLKLEYESCKNSKRSLQAEYDYLLKDRTNWKSKYDKCTKDLENAGSGSSGKVKELESKIVTLNRTIATLNSELKRKDESLNTLQASYEKLSKEKKGLSTENISLKAEVTSLKSKLKAMTSERDALKIKLQNCQNAGGEGASSPKGELQVK